MKRNMSARTLIESQTVKCSSSLLAMSVSLVKSLEMAKANLQRQAAPGCELRKHNMGTALHFAYRMVVCSVLQASQFMS